MSPVTARFDPVSSANCYERGGVPAMFGPRFAWPHKCLRNELNKTEYEPTNDRSIYYGSGYLIPAFHGIERTFSWLLSLRLDALLYMFLLSMRPYRSLSCNMRAGRFLFPTIPTRRTLSVTNVTSLVFIFDLHLLDNGLHFLDSHSSDLCFGIESQSSSSSSEA